MAPILEFPPEITSAIFKHCVLNAYNEAWHREGFSTLSENSAPLLLGRICRQWRSIAWSTPELWTAIQVECPYFIEAFLPSLDRWLLRTGSLPLAIDIKYRAHPDTSSDGLRQLVRRYASQLQDFSLDVTPGYDLFKWNELERLPALKKISLTSLSFSGYQGMITGFKDAPELKDVHFLSRFNPTNIDLPWAQLTTVRMDHVTLRECLLVLSLTTNLVTGHFGLWNSNGRITVVPPLLHLKSLVLRSYGDPSTILLAHLTTPALVSLEAAELDLDIWSAFLARSRCALEHLAFAGTGWTAAMFKQALNGLPSVTEFEVLCVGPSFYEVVRLLKAHPQFLPNLRSFKEELTGMDVDWPPHKDGAGLARLVVEMLEVRRDAGLGTFELYTTKGFVGSPELSMVRLRVLVEGGMDIYISGSDSWVR